MAVLGLVLIGSLMTTAYLVGRSSVPAPPPPAPAAPSTVVVTVTPPPPVAATPLPLPSPTPVAVAASVAPTPSATVAPRPTPRKPVRPGSAEARAVAAYFAAIDRVGGPGKMGDDPNQMATDQINALLAGDSSGFDRMIGEAQASAAQLRAIRPPAPCRNWHAECLAIDQDGMRMLTAVKRAVATSDLTSLGG
ncbi:MAG: hypothetical protein ACYCW6_27040, partial [Candidatus Xenobia bacterium]